MPISSPRETRRSAFNGALQFRERVIPLSSDHFQGAPCLVQSRGFELPQSLASDFRVTHQTRGCKHIQVLCNGLPGDVRSRRKLCDGHGTTDAQRGDQPQAHLVAQSRENRRAMVQRLVRRCCFTTRRHAFEYFSSVHPTQMNSCGRRSHDGPAEFCQSPIQRQ